MSKSFQYCTACGLKGCKTKPHPLLSPIPICDTCNDLYYSGEFTIDETNNEIYCRWCGTGSGKLILCDSCPKSFCSGCIERNFGTKNSLMYFSPFMLKYRNINLRKSRNNSNF